MNLREFRKAGHFPSLLCAFLYFDISFMIWVMLGPLAITIMKDFNPQLAGEANDAYNTRAAPYIGLMVGLPILGGSILRLILGPMTDRFGGKFTGMLGMIITAIPLLMGWLWVSNYEQMLIVGFLLGVAGASFAVALPLASRWYPPEHQGLAMGIAGAGNSGTALATLFAPLLVLAIGSWQPVFGFALIPLTITFVIFMLFAKDAPNQPPPKPLMAYVQIFRHADTWWFCVLYSVTFGGFVGLASFLNTFFKNQYFADDVATGQAYAAVFTTLCVVAGSFLRPVGGYLADRFGGIRMLVVLYAGVAVAMGVLAFLPGVWLAFTVLFLAMGLLGMGNGSVFQLVPQRFPKEIGVITGIVGAAGGIGGFFLPTLLGAIKGSTGSYGTGFAFFALCSAISVLIIMGLRTRWESTFLANLKSKQEPTPELSTAVQTP
jgi:NNP family nitrate/nitrite transporter-like MFS transporter